MAPNDIPHHEHDDDHDDDRPAAVRHAENGAAGWRGAAQHQADAAPDHGDFYTLAGELTQTVRALGDLASELAIQVANYPRGRVLRDDEPGHNPADRLDAAWSLVSQLCKELRRAEVTAGRFWSTVGHIGVEPDPVPGPTSARAADGGAADGGPADGGSVEGGVSR